MNPLTKASPPAEDWWINVADMMTGLMMLFMFIAVAYMTFIQKTATSYFDMQKSLYEDLHREFRNDLSKWKANIDPKTGTIRFEEPDILFLPGSSVLRPGFQDVLNDFFPRYLRIVMGPTFGGSVEELRIEGHTSSDWMNQIGSDEAYFKNMGLSQDRTRSVLQFVWDRVEAKDRAWLKSRLTANGLSSSHLVMDSATGKEIPELSRRVEFRVRMKAEAQIKKMAANTVE